MASGSDVKYSIGADSSDLITALGQANAKIRELQGNVAKTQKSTDDFSKAMSSFGTILKAIGITAIGASILKFVQFAGKVDSVTRSFRGLSAGASMTSDALVQAISAGAQGTMSNLEIMEKSNLALQLMGTSVADKLPQLATIALATARATGQQVSQAYGDLIVAASRQSVMILDNVGISSAAASGYMQQYAQSIGTTTKNFTDAQKQQAFFYAIMQAGNDLVRRTDLSTLTLGERIQILESQFNNIGTTIAMKATPALMQLGISLSSVGSKGTSAATSIGKIIGSIVLIATMGVEALKNVGATFEAMWNNIMIAYFRASAGMTRGLAQLAGSLGMNDLQLRLQLNTLDYEQSLQNAELRGEQLYNNVNNRMVELDAAWEQLWSDNENQAANAAARTGGPRGGAEDQKKMKLSEYYEYIGRLREADLAKEQEHYQELVQMTAAGSEQRRAIEAAHAQHVEEIQRKHNVALQTLQEEFTRSTEDALKNVESSTKDALQEMLTGENGWDAWQKNMKKILQRFVVDIMWAVAKAQLLQAVVAGFGLATGGPEKSIVGGVVSKVLGFEKGNVPVFAQGNIPVFASGGIPSGHELAYVDYRREAIINADSTRANQELLRFINNNPGVSVPVGSDDRPINIYVDGEKLFSINERYREGRAQSMGAQNYGTRSVYK